MANNTVTNNGKNASELIGLIDSRAKKVFSEENKGSLKTKIGSVVSYDDANYSAVVSFPEEGENSNYTYYNKTSEVLAAGDTVRVYYTNNLATGWIGARGGEPVFKQIEIDGVGVGRPSPWDVTSEYFNDYTINTTTGLPNNQAGTPGKTGYYSTARGSHASAQGEHCVASGSNVTIDSDSTYCHAEGTSMVINKCSGCHAEGRYYTIENNVCSHVEGEMNTVSFVSDTHVEGTRNSAQGLNDDYRLSNCHIEGSSQELYLTGEKSLGECCHLEGYNNKVIDSSFSHAEGQNSSITSSKNCHAEGYTATITNSESSHAEGNYCALINSNNCHTEGVGVQIIRGDNCFAGGSYCQIGSPTEEKTRTTDSMLYCYGGHITDSSYCFAFGYVPKIDHCRYSLVFSGNSSAATYTNNCFILGQNNLLKGSESNYLNDSLIIGESCTAEGNYSSIIGHASSAKKENSHVCGRSCTAEGESDYLYGDYLSTDSIGANRFVIGRLNNIEDSSDKLFVIGNGDTNGRSNAFSVDKEGNVFCKGTITSGGSSNSFVPYDAEQAVESAKSVFASVMGV